MSSGLVRAVADASGCLDSVMVILANHEAPFWVSVTWIVLFTVTRHRRLENYQTQMSKTLYK